MCSALKNKLVILFLLLSSIISAQIPNITSFSPTTVCQGDLVTITGTNFTGTTSVKLGSLPASNITVRNDKTIEAYVDINATSGKVIVTNSKGADTTTETLTIKQTPQPSLNDISNQTGFPFTNCDGNLTYTLKVQNTSQNVLANSNYDIDWGDGTSHFTQTDWPLNSQASHIYNGQGYFKIIVKITPAN